MLFRSRNAMNSTYNELDKLADELTAELVAVVRKYGPTIKKLYKSAAGDPQVVDGTLDTVVAAFIEELERYGYYFDTASVDNVLYFLNRRINTDDWEVVPIK
jgi:hypothetical protein